MGGSYRYCYSEVVPFTALVAVECISVGGNTLYKQASSQGLNYYAFVVYTFLIGSLLLLPYSFIMSRRSVLPRISLSIVLKIVILGGVGYIAQMLGYVGIRYGSPTLSSVTSNLKPAFTFILAIIFRMENLNIRSSSSRAKIMGTIVSISGAIVVTLYNGPSILISSQPSDSLHHLHHLSSSQSNWIIGALILTSQTLLLSFIYVCQAQIMKEYPVDFIVVLIYNFSALIVSAIVGFIMENNLDAWKIMPGIVLASIIYLGFFAGFLTGIVHTWGLRVKGPLYIALFKPLSILIAVVMGVIFLGDTLHLGSQYMRGCFYRRNTVAICPSSRDLIHGAIMELESILGSPHKPCIIGGAIISIGFYVVIWGKAKEEKAVESNFEGSYSASTSSSTQSQTMPLLQGHAQNV